EYADPASRGAAHGKLLAVQDQGDRGDRRDALARRPNGQDARGTARQAEESWPGGPVHHAHGRGSRATRGAGRRERPLEFSRTGSGVNTRSPLVPRHVPRTSRNRDRPPSSSWREPSLSDRDRAEAEDDHGQNHDGEAAEDWIAVRADEDLGAAENKRGQR